jgi:RNA polymerase sigma-70 factor (ECF subfamily)
MAMESEALAAMYASYGYAVHRRCARLLGSPAEADDALQEVFLIASRHGTSIRNESPLPWLYRVADRHCFEIIRKRKRRADPIEVQAPEAHDADRTHLVAQVLGACRPGIRDVAVLYFIDELTQDEVATEVGVSRKTVKKRLAQFLAMARGLVEERA